MMYQVFGGADEQAVVCAEAIKRGGSLEFQNISVDLLFKEDGDAAALWVVGEEEVGGEVRDQMRDFVKLRKRYVE